MKKLAFLVLLIVTVLSGTLVGKAIASNGFDAYSMTTHKIENGNLTNKVTDLISFTSQNIENEKNNDSKLVSINNVSDNVINSSPSTDEEILQELSRYKDLENTYLMQPGWTSITFDQYDLLPLNSPKPLPSQYRKEFWSHFDGNQKVTEQVDYLISSETGKVPLGVFVNGELTSLWNDGQKVKKDPYTPAYDLYLVSSIQTLVESNSPLELSFKQEILANQSVSLIELRTQFSTTDKQWINIQLDKPVWGQYEKFTFNSQTGLLLKYEHYYVLDDMSLVLSSVTDNFEYSVASEAPSDVTNLIATGGK